MRKRPRFLANKVFVQNSVQNDNKETAKVRVTVPLHGEFTGDQSIPRRNKQRDSKAQSVSIWWRQNVLKLIYTLVNIHW